MIAWLIALFLGTSALAPPPYNCEVGFCIPHVRPLLGPVMSGYGVRISDFTGDPRKHEGLDIAAPVGTRVVAAGRGVIVAAMDGGDGYGLRITIDHGRQLTSHYAHLSRALVRVGQEVQAGEVIALSGDSGRVTGSHLHFEIRACVVGRDRNTRCFPRNPSRYRMVTPHEDPTRISLSRGAPRWVRSSQRLIAFAGTK